MRKHFRAEDIEAEVWECVSSLYGDKDLLASKVREAYSQKRRELSGPSVSVEILSRRLDKLGRDWLKWQEAYRADAISVADLKARRAEIEEEREGIERTLEQARGKDAELEDLEREEARILAGIEDSETVGEADWTPESRTELYRDLQLRVLQGTEGRHVIFAGVSRKVTSYARGGP
jgi:hypothetical protein